MGGHKRGQKVEVTRVVNDAREFHNSTQTNVHTHIHRNNGEIKEPHTGTDMNFKLLNLNKEWINSKRTITPTTMGINNDAKND